MSIIKYKLLQKIGAGIATAGLLAAVLTPAAFAQTITVSGNGAGSTNTVNVSSNNTTSVSQSNLLIATNVVTSSTNTGGNTASFNTGGSTVVTSGSALSTVSVKNLGNVNVASFKWCGTCVFGCK